MLPSYLNAHVDPTDHGVARWTRQGCITANKAPGKVLPQKSKSLECNGRMIYYSSHPQTSLYQSNGTRSNASIIMSSKYTPLPNRRTREEAIAGMKQHRENHMSITQDLPLASTPQHTHYNVRSMLYKVHIGIASPTGMIRGFAFYATELMTELVTEPRLDDHHFTVQTLYICTLQIYKYICRQSRTGLSARLLIGKLHCSSIAS